MTLLYKKDGSLDFDRMLEEGMSEKTKQAVKKHENEKTEPVLKKSKRKQYDNAVRRKSLENNGETETNE